MEIRYFCAICGAGKTRALARYAKHFARNGDKVLIVQKTIKLIVATIRDEIGVGPFSVTSFHCDNNESGNVSVMRPSIFDGFKSVTIAGANFKKSMLYKVWSAKGVEFQPLPPFMKKHLRPEFRAGTHENGDLLKIYYAYNSNWSKHHRDQPTALTTGEMVERKANIVRVVGELIGDDEFAFMANNDWSNGDLVSWKKAIRMSGSPHGDNSYMGLHNIAILSALNPTPNRGSFLKEVLGLGAEDIREALYHDPVYQAVCRISIRNPDDMTPKRVVVMDHAMAVWIGDMFPGSEVIKLDMGEDMKPETRGRKKSENPSPAAVKKRNQRANRAALIVTPSIID